MNFVAKIRKVTDCFEVFRNSSNSKEIKKFIDLFFPMFYQNNNHRLEISVGKKMPNYQFSPWLSNVLHDFTVTPDCWEEDEPRLTIKDAMRKTVVMAINLSAINNMCIKKDEDKEAKFCRYNIYFNYNNEVDYCMNLVIKENEA